MSGNERFKVILSEWAKSVEQMNASPWFQRLGSGDLDLCHYKGFLLETYHHAGLNPQIQAFATMFFKENHRDIFGMFYKHATSEIGHDLMALSDLCNLGESEEVLRATRPLPETAAFNAFVLHQIQFVDPVTYLGYLFHLEFLPTRQGPGYMNHLKKMGVPDNALTFLEEHATVDVGHNKLMEKYVEKLITTDRQQQLVIDAAADSCKLHQRMIEASLMNGEAMFGQKAA